MPPARLRAVAQLLARGVSPRSLHLRGPTLPAPDPPASRVPGRSLPPLYKAARRDRLQKGETRHCALTGLEPIGNRPLRQLCRGVVLCDEIGLALGDNGELLFQRSRDLAVILAAPAQQGRLMGR